MSKPRLPWWKVPYLLLVGVVATVIEMRREAALLRAWGFEEWLHKDNKTLVEKYATDTWFHRKLAKLQDRYEMPFG